MAGLFGPFLVLTFSLSQAFRDVYFGRLFQGVDFFAIILLAFVLSTVVFAPLAWVRARADFAILRANLWTVLAMNVTTAIAWICYFFGLTHLEPSIVNTIHSGMAPLVTAAMGAFGITLAKPQRVGAWEWTSYAGIALSIVALWWVVLSGQSGATADAGTAALALTLLLVSGSSITVSLLYAKRLNDRGVHSAAVVAVRYLVIIAVAAGIEIARGGGGSFGGIHGIRDGAILAFAAMALVVLPLYAQQEGVSRTAPLTAQIVRALGPVFVFALEQIDHRLHYAPAVLICILAYSLFVITGNIAHGWRPEVRAART